MTLTPSAALIPRSVCAAFLILCNAFASSPSPGDGQPEVLTSGDILQRYLRAAKAAGPYCIVATYERPDLKSGNILRVDTFEQRNSDSVYLFKSRSVATNKAGKVLVEAGMIANADGVWKVYPSIKAAVRIRKPQSDGADYQPPEAKLQLQSTIETRVVMGEKCYVIVGTFPDDYRRARAKRPPVKDDRSGIDVLPSSEAKIVEAQEVLFISQRNFLLRGKRVMGQDGQTLSKIDYKKAELQPRLDEEAFDVPMGYRLLLPKSQEEETSLRKALVAEEISHWRAAVGKK
jgi:hypothetical protein